MIFGYMVGYWDEAGSWRTGEASSDGDVSVLHGLEVVVTVANEDNRLALFFEMISVSATSTSSRYCW